MTFSSRVIPIVAACHLFALIAVTEARAASVDLDPGESRNVTLQDAKPVALRLSNEGDCSVGIIFRDTSRNLSLQVALQPNAVIDVNTLSAEVKHVTLHAREEGNTGARIVARPLLDGVEVQMPEVGVLPRTDPYLIYLNEEGEAAPFVTYRIRNIGEGSFTIRTSGVGGFGSDTTVFPDQTVEFPGKWWRIEIRTSFSGIALITKNPSE